MGALEGDFAIVMSLYHGLELMEQHGLRSFYKFLEETLSTDQSSNKTKQELLRNPSFCEMMNTLQQKYSKPLRSLSGRSPS